MATGGLDLIESQIGVSHFVYYIAEELGCTVKKAREYIQICKMATIARHRIQSLKARVNDAETPSHDHAKEENRKEEGQEGDQV